MLRQDTGQEMFCGWKSFSHKDNIRRIEEETLPQLLISVLNAHKHWQKLPSASSKDNTLCCKSSIHGNSLMVNWLDLSHFSWAIHLHLKPKCQYARHHKLLLWSNSLADSTGQWLHQVKSLVLLPLYSNHYLCSPVFFLCAIGFSQCANELSIILCCCCCFLILRNCCQDLKFTIDVFRLLKSILWSNCIITAPVAVRNAPLHNKRYQKNTNSWQSSRLLRKVFTFCLLFLKRKRKIGIPSQRQTSWPPVTWRPESTHFTCVTTEFYTQGHKNAAISLPPSLYNPGCAC